MDATVFIVFVRNFSAAFNFISLIVLTVGCNIPKIDKAFDKRFAAMSGLF